MSASPYCIWTFTKMNKARDTAYKLGKLLNKGRRMRNDNELLSIYLNAPAESIVLETRKITQA